MPESINFTGLQSGIDTSAIVAELIRLERIPVQRVQTRQELERLRQTTLNEISTKLSALRSSADKLRDLAFWTGVPHGTSGDEDSFSIDVAADSPKATYQIQVKRLATGDVWGQTARSGERMFSATYAGSGVLAGATTKLTALTGTTGTSLGLAVGQQISLSGTQGGSAVTSATAYTITANSTLDDVKVWAQQQIPGSTVSVESGGRLKIKSPIGTDQEVTSLSLRTVGNVAPLFDAQFATSTAVASATGVGKVQASDTLHITAGAMTFDVAVTAGMTMQQVASAITNANGGVTAGVTDGRLRISATDTGATGGLVTITSTGAAAADVGFTRIVTAADALVNVDGIDVTSARNTTTSILPGATLTLKKSMTTTATASTDPKYVDSKEAETRAKDFVESYNAVLDLVNQKITEKKVRDPKTTDEQRKGLLFNNGSLTTVIDGLRGALASAVTSLAPGANLAVFGGISTGATAATGFNAEALSGKLQFDSTKFQQLFSSNRDALKDLFAHDGPTAAEDGFAQRISDLTQGYTKTGGVIQAAIDGSSAQVKNLQERIDHMNERIDAKEKLLKEQFLAMERVIGQLKAAGSGIGSLTQQNSSSGR